MMENQEEVVSGVRVLDGDGLGHKSSGVNGSGNLGYELLEDLDSYLDDINDRLTISRMVSDSVIRGMVSAVERGADEKVAAKELEVASLKESLRVLQLGADEIKFFGFPEDSMTRGTLGGLRNLARKEIKKLKEEIGNGTIECGSIRRISSGSELLENTTESCVGVDKTLCNLSDIVDSMFHLAKASFCEWREEEKFRGELEAMVIQSCIRSVQEEFEEKMWDQSAASWLENIKEISSLRQELDIILKSLSVSENGHVQSHGSHDSDHCHRLSSHVSAPSSLWDVDVKFDESETSTPKHWGAAELKHMTPKELVDYFNTVIASIKRNHESKMLKMTESYFSLMREKDRGSSLPQKKDNKEFDVLKKKIPEVILKLDDILVDNDKLPKFGNNGENVGVLKSKLDNLLSENCHLRDLLADKKKELEHLASQVSNAAGNEEKLQKSIANLKSSLEDARLEAFVTEDVYKCAIREVTARTELDTENLTVKTITTQDARDFKYEIADSEMESLIMEGFLTTIFGEAIRGAESQLRTLDANYSHEKEIRVALELKAVEKEKELTFLVKENERLKEEVEEISDAHKKQQERIVVEIDKLNHKLEQTMEQLNKADEERRMLLIVVQKKENDLLLAQTKENEQRTEMGRVVVLVHGLSKALADTECKISERIDQHNVRLACSTYHLSSLIQKAARIRKSELRYKERLERRCSDLQMAEAEVDLLGDEVDALLSILEKVYIALEHYLPVLRHYPGIAEILKLVRRELSGESTKPEQSRT